jgi:hypothetical protein
MGYVCRSMANIAPTADGPDGYLVTGTQRIGHRRPGTTHRLRYPRIEFWSRDVTGAALGALMPCQPIQWQNTAGSRS